MNEGLGRSSRRAQHDAKMKRPSPERREATAGILRLDIGKPRRSSGGSVDFRGLPGKLDPQVEPPSPQPSVDRLSVTFAERSDCSESSVKVNVFDPGSPPAQQPDMEKVRFGTEPEDDDEDDYSASVSVIMQRRESTRRGSGRRRRRRPSSPFSGCDGESGLSEGRRRSSVFTNSSGETAISVEEGTTQEQIFENIRLNKEVLGSVKQQPWAMRRKLKLVQQAKSYVKRHEGELQERLALSKSTRDILARFNILLIKKLQFLRRELANTMTVLIPWELRIKEIESHFGSAVASYFTFLRWMFWVNLVITIVLACFVAIPEMLTADAASAGERKVMLPHEQRTAKNLLTLWDFEGVLKYSVIFYGYYTNQEKSSTGYRLPFAYFMTGLAVYVYSFVATLRRMAENSRMSKLSEKGDECAFTWKLFTGWDYMIGNAETAHNRVASLILGFKEALLEETERKKDEKNWKVIALRVLVNFLVLCLLVFSAYIVFVVVERSTRSDPDASSWWRQNEITVSLSIISIIFPIFFELLGLMEGYHPRKCLRIQLARIMVLNLLNLYTLIFSLFWKISTMVNQLKVIKQQHNIPDPEYYDGSISSTTVAPLLSHSDPEAFLENVTSLCRRVQVDCSVLADVTLVGSAIVAATFANLTTTTLLPYVSASTTTPSSTAKEIYDEDDYYYYEEEDEEFNRTVLNFTDSFPGSETTGSTNEELEPTAPTPNKTSTFAVLFMTVVNVITSSVMPAFTGVTSVKPSSTTDWTVAEWNVTTEGVEGAETVETTTEAEEERLCYVTECPPPPTETTTQSVPEETAREVKVPHFDLETRKKLRSLCWETMFGQELVKLTVMDLVLTVVSILLLDFFRAVFVRVMNNCWCWDLEKQFPQYGDFKIAENILHLVNNQGMVWMGMFFSPGLPAINLVKLAIMMYLRSWAVLTCNVPHEVVFRASRSNNFYLALLLTMLFLCVLPVGFAIVWIEPSWHCGPFSNYRRIYHLFTQSLLKALPRSLHKVLDYVASPSIIIPLLMLLVLIIYYLVSLTNSLREANNDLKTQLRRERTEERRKMFQMVDKKRKGSGDSETPFGKWKKLLDLSPKPSIPSGDVECGEKVETSGVALNKTSSRKELISRLMKRALRKSSGGTDNGTPLPDDGSDGDQVDSAFDDQELKGKDRSAKPSGRKPPTSVSSTQRNSLASEWSENIPVIKISKTESDECILRADGRRKKQGRGLRRFRQLVEKQISKQRKDKAEMSRKLNRRAGEMQKKEEAKRRVKEKLRNLGRQELDRQSSVPAETEVVEGAEKPCPIATAETVSSDLDMSVKSLKVDPEG